MHLCVDMSLTQAVDWWNDWRRSHAGSLEEERLEEPWQPMLLLLILIPQSQVVAGLSKHKYLQKTLLWTEFFLYPPRLPVSSHINHSRPLRRTATFDPPTVRTELPVIVL